MANHAREEPTRHRGDRFDRRARRRRRPGSSRSTTCIQVLALIAVIATVLPAGALAAGKGQVRSEAVTLGSESCPESAPDPEACTPPQEVGSFASTDGLRVVFNHPGDCSAIYLLLYRDGHKVGQTDAAKPGSSDEVTIAWPNDGEDHSLSAVGHGVAGECNTGEYLHAWSGNVEVLYTPPPEGVTIHGTVRIAGEEGIPAEATGVPGATVQVSGPGGKNTVAVSPTGAYSVHFKKAGSYAVLPRVPTAVTRGGRNPVNPESRTVTVALGDSATANFKVKDPLRVEIELSRDRVPADGEQSVRATVTATASGKPVKGLDV